VARVARPARPVYAPANEGLRKIVSTLDLGYQSIHAKEMNSVPVPYQDAPFDHQQTSNLAKSLKAGSLRQVPRPATGRNLSCFWDVHNAVRNHGGSIIPGWRFYWWPGAYIAATHHAIWRKEDGSEVDLTPQYNSGKGISVFADIDQKIPIDVSIPLHRPTIIPDHHAIISQMPIILASIYAYKQLHAVRVEIDEQAFKEGAVWGDAKWVSWPTKPSHTLESYKKIEGELYNTLGDLQRILKYYFSGN
jgi:hypothetical protein